MSNLQAVATHVNSYARRVSYVLVVAAMSDGPGEDNECFGEEGSESSSGSVDNNWNWESSISCNGDEGSNNNGGLSSSCTQPPPPFLPVVPWESLDWFTVLSWLASLEIS